MVQKASDDQWHSQQTPGARKYNFGERVQKWLGMRIQ